MIKKNTKKIEKKDIGKIEAKIRKVIEKIRPSLQMDGGDLHFVSFDQAKGLLKVELLGRCAHCPMSQMTMKLNVEAKIVKAVPEVKTVTAVDLSL